MNYSKHTEKLRLELITYGSPGFDKEKFLPVKTNYKELSGSKPLTGGLWASVSGSEYGWIDWSKENDFNLESLEESFEFIFFGEVIVVRNIADLDKLPWKKSALAEHMPESIGYFNSVIDYDLLADKKTGIDAIYLTLEGLGSATSLFSSQTGKHLYGWDCESVLVINPDCCSQNRDN